MQGALIEEIDGERYITIFNERGGFVTQRIPPGWTVKQKDGFIDVIEPLPSEVEFDADVCDWGVNSEGKDDDNSFPA